MLSYARKHPILFPAAVTASVLAAQACSSTDTVTFELEKMGVGDDRISLAVELPNDWAELSTSGSSAVGSSRPPSVDEHDFEDLHIAYRFCPDSDDDAEAAFQACVASVFESAHGESIDGAERESLDGGREWVKKDLEDSDELAATFYISVDGGENIVTCGARFVEHKNLASTYREVCETVEVD